MSPDEFSYTMALKACSASRWPGDSRSNDSGCLTNEGQNKEAPRLVTRGAEAKDCSVQEGKVVLPANRARNAVEVRQPSYSFELSAGRIDNEESDSLSLCLVLHDCKRHQANRNSDKWITSIPAHVSMNEFCCLSSFFPNLRRNSSCRK